MNRQYIKIRTGIDKTSDLYRVIESTIIEYKDYREIFDNAVQFEYGKTLDEYSEKGINAIMVNNIRHNCSNYDKMLKPMHRIHRSENDYIQYKNSVLEKIANVYPFLKDECNRQKRKLDMVSVEVG